MEEILINPDFKKFNDEPKEEVPTVKKHVVYRHARFGRRVLANLIDFIIFIITFISLFLSVRGIVSSTEHYQFVNEETDRIQRESGLYKKNYSTDRVMDVVAYWRMQDSSTSSKAWQLRLAIYDFLNYCDNVCEEDQAKEIRESYDKYCKDATYKYDINGVMHEEHFFTFSEGSYIENPDVNQKYVTREIFFSHGYAPFIENYALGYMIQYVPNYYNYTRYLSNVMLAEIIPCYPVAGILVYLVPPLIFRRGRKTIGKALYNIGLLDQRNCYSPSLGRTIARQSIVVFAELCLSVVTLCVPCIISFTMMAFSKKKQGFPDYMLGLQEVDSSEDKIYFSEDEIIKEQVRHGSGHVDFNLPKNDY